MENREYVLRFAIKRKDGPGDRGQFVPLGTTYWIRAKDDKEAMEQAEKLMKDTIRVQLDRLDPVGYLGSLEEVTSDGTGKTEAPGFAGGPGMVGNSGRTASR